MLEVVGYLVGVPSHEVDEEGEGVYVDSPAQQTANHSPDNEHPVPAVVGEREHCYAHVQEDEVLRQKRHELEQLKHTPHHLYSEFILPSFWSNRMS